MGVLGLTPFLQKTCPNVLKTLPERFKALNGKTVVLDGTLITQRLHFAPMPHTHRHVLGWYKLVKELQDCGVRSICVFDGKERNFAKAQEVERRRQVRRVDTLRSSIEASRLGRLRKLSEVLRSCQSLDSPDREKATTNLRETIQRAKGFVHSYQIPPETLYDYYHTVPPPPDPSESEIYEALSAQVDPFVLDTLPDLPEADDNHVVIPDSDSSAPPYTDPTESLISTNSPVENLPVNNNALETELPKPTASSPNIYFHKPGIPNIDDTADQGICPENASSMLASLYLDYRLSIPKQIPLSSSDSLPDPSKADKEFAMTKTQYQLIAAEGEVWDQLAQSAAPDNGIAMDFVFALEEKSNTLSESYQRRSNPPTAQTYDESKEILDAMGIPCIESEGPFEAEALASSLVISGLADYVASEDTDVLIYEAPLIRNFTSRKDPLLLISGLDVRTVLQLDRASYIDFALLLGTDFSQRIKNVGPQRALKFIRQYGTIEEVIEHEKQYPPRISVTQYLTQVEMARLIFQTLPPVPDTQLLQSAPVDDSKVSAILERHGLYRAAMYDWDHNAALDGNYFDDNPNMQ